MYSDQFGRRQFLTLLGATGLGLAMAACGSTAPATPAASSGSASTGEPKSGGKLRIGILVEQEDFFVSGDNGANQWMFKLFEPLVQLGPNNTIMPRLAESWTTSDATTYLFKIRQGVKFHDGSTMTAEDVKYSIDVQRDPASRSSSLLTSIDSVDVKDSSTVQVKLKAAFSPMLLNLTTPASLVFPKALHSKADKSFGTKPVGTGPFKLAEYLKGDHVNMTRFDGYWGKKPYLDAVDVKLVLDENVKLVNLKTGNLDIVDSLPPKDVKGMESDPGFTVVSPPRYGYRSFRMHNKLEPFTNKSLRQAVQFALDPAPIIKAIMFDTVVPVHGPIGVDMIGYDPNFKGVTPSKEQALAKLKEGGQPNGFSFTLVIPNSPNDVQVGQAIAAQLADVGIKANLEQVDRGIYNTRLIAKQLVANIGGNLSGRAEADSTLALYYREKSSSNFNGYANPTVEDLIGKAQSELDQPKRIALYRQIQEQVVPDAGEAYLWSPYQTFRIAMSKKVQGYQANDTYLNLDNVWLSE